MARRPRNAHEIMEIPCNLNTPSANGAMTGPIAHTRSRDQLDELEAHLGKRWAISNARSRKKPSSLPRSACGTSSALGNEFHKVNRHQIWLDRVFWMLVGDLRVSDHLQRAGSVWLRLGGIGTLSTWWHGRRGAHQGAIGHFAAGPSTFRPTPPRCG